MGNWLFRQMMRMQIFFFRLSNGKMMNSMRGMPLLILTTVGRKSGKVRETPVIYVQYGTNFIVAASNAGRDAHPGWYVNLRANPQATIDVPGATLKVNAHVAEGAERAELWAELVTRAAFFEDYRRSTSREIPVVVLTPVANYSGE